MFTYDSGEFVRLARQVRRDGRLERLREAAQGLGEGWPAARPLVCYYIEFGGIFNDRMISASIRAAPSRSSAARIRTAGTRDGVRAGWCTTSSACLSSRSATCKATTAQVPFGRGTYGARSAVVGGSALKARRRCHHREGKADGRRP